MGRSCVSRLVSNELIKNRSSETAESSIIIYSLVIVDQEVNGTGFSNFDEGASFECRPSATSIPLFLQEKSSKYPLSILMSFVQYTNLNLITDENKSN